MKSRGPEKLKPANPGRAAAGEYLVEALPTARCKCGAAVELRTGAFSLVQHGGCEHFVNAERIEGVLYVRFRELGGCE